MTDNNSKRFAVPHGWRVRYDYHDKPRGISAILINEHGVVRSVGFAKFNPHDEGFNAATGRSIALGRALAKLPRHLTRPFQTGRITRRRGDALGAAVPPWPASLSPYHSATL